MFLRPHSIRSVQTRAEFFNNLLVSTDPFSWGWSDVNAPPKSVTGSLPCQWHHPISPNNNTFKFHLHPLVQGAGWSQSDLKNLQKAILLSGHSGPHCKKQYHPEILERMDLAFESVQDPSNPTQCKTALEGVIDQANSDISSGKLRPYANKDVKPVPGYKPTPYGRAIRGCGGVLPWLDLLNMIQMITTPYPVGNSYDEQYDGPRDPLGQPMAMFTTPSESENTETLLRGVALNYAAAFCIFEEMTKVILICDLFGSSHP
jgi:hypothetical protein